MADASNYLKDALADLVFRNAAFVAPTSLVVSVTTSAITDADTGASLVAKEPSGNGYARTAVVYDAPVADSGQVLNQEVVFPQASGSWGSLTDWALVDQLGNVITHDSLTNAPLAIGNLDTLRFLAGQLPQTTQ